MSKLKLLNATTEQALSIDAAQRVLSCPWATPLLVCDKQFKTLEVHGVTRDRLTLAKEWQQTLRTATAPAATAADFAALRADVLKIFEKVAAAAAPAPAPAPEAAPAAPAPAAAPEPAAAPPEAAPAADESLDVLAELRMAQNRLKRVKRR